MSAIESFERYDEEVRSLLQCVQQESSSAESFDLLQQCDELLQQMALEARSMGNENASLKDDLLEMVRARKEQIRLVKQDIERKSLMLGAEAAVREPRVLQRNEDMLAQQNETLERARRAIEETESLGSEITKELGSSRETMTSAHGKVKEVSGMTEQANKILDSMNRRWFSR